MKLTETIDRLVFEYEDADEQYDDNHAFGPNVAAPFVEACCGELQGHEDPGGPGMTVNTGKEEVARAILREGETCATNIEIGWEDLWRQEDLQLAKAAVECLVRLIPCPVCGKVMGFRYCVEGGGMGMTTKYTLRCGECSLTVDLPPNFDLHGSAEALYEQVRRYIGRVVRPTGLTYPLCLTRERNSIRAWYGVRDPDTGKVYRPEEYRGRFLWGEVKG